jgi:hypothetical protein
MKVLIELLAYLIPLALWVWSLWYFAKKDAE